MKNKLLLLLAFLLVIMAQWYVPGRMILNQEEILNTGTPFKFKTAPIDPNDPFRGKYIVLNFDVSEVRVASKKDWNIGDRIYLELDRDSLGYARVKKTWKEAPSGSSDYVAAKVSSLWSENNEVNVELPFERFYMEESKAYKAEQIYREAQIDSNQVAYALVMVKAGEAALKDVFIDGRSVKDIVKSKAAKEQSQ